MLASGKRAASPEGTRGPALPILRSTRPKRPGRDRQLVAAIALRRPEVFATAFSSAGALRFAQHAARELGEGSEDWNRPERWQMAARPPVAIAGFASQRGRTPPGRVFETPAQALAADPFTLVDGIDARHAPYLHLDCGSQDALCEESRALATRLRARGLAFSFLELPGDHEVPYWALAFEHTRAILSRRFDAAKAAATEPPGSVARRVERRPIRVKRMRDRSPAPTTCSTRIDGRADRPGRAAPPGQHRDRAAADRNGRCPPRVGDRSQPSYKVTLSALIR